MSVLAAIARMLAATCALILALLVFYQPLTALLPARAAAVLDQLPGVGPSGGFVIQVISEPTGAEVRIDGIPRGTTPFFGNVACRRDEDVVLELEAAGWSPWRRVLRCRQSGTAVATAHLQRPSP